MKQLKGRIVVVTPNEPYPFGQANGRWCHALLKGLDDAGWQVRCLSTSTNPAWERGAREAFAGTGVDLAFFPLEPGNGFDLRKKWRSLRQPFSYPLTDPLRRAVDAERRNGCDVLHLEQLWSAYLADGGDRVLTSIHHLEHIDLDGEWHWSWHYLRSKAMMLHAEKRLLDRLNHVRTTTERLADAVRGLNGAVRTHIVPIALEPSLFRFEADATGDDPVIGFLANMRWNPGYQAAVRLLTRILPRIRKHRPETRVLLAGWGAGTLSPYAGPGIEIAENVSAAEPYFRRLQVLAYPLLKGSGMMAKVLEALAYGVPVVTTTEGAEGFAIEDGVHGFIADDDDAFAEKVTRLLDDGALRRTVRRNGRDLIEQCYSPAAAVAQLERAYAAL